MLARQQGIDFDAENWEEDPLFNQGNNKPPEQQSEPIRKRDQALKSLAPVAAAAAAAKLAELKAALKTTLSRLAVLQSVLFVRPLKRAPVPN
jgi:hypothetical protein